MSRPRKADVIVPVDRGAELLPRYVGRLLERSGSTLGRLVIIGDDSEDHALRAVAKCLTDLDSRVHVLRSPRDLGWGECCNTALSERQGDAVLLNAYASVSLGWLDELAAVAHSEERVACAVPLGNMCLVPPTYAGNEERTTWSPDEEVMTAACSGLPRWTTVPRPDAICIYFRSEALDAVGLFDPALGTSPFVLDDWTMRSQSLGFIVKRANRAFALPPALTDGQDAAPDGTLEDELLNARYPHLQHQLNRFQQSLDRLLPSHAIDSQATGKLRVALDLRHLPRVQVGTRTYAVSLAQALAGSPEIDLTLLVNEPEQADGIKGRVITPNEWTDDVSIVHKPAQIFDKRELQLLFDSAAHFVITYQDMIAYRVPLVFPTESDFDQYRSTNSLCLQAAQKILVYSDSTAREIVEEFGVPREEVSVVHLGVDCSLFAVREPGDQTVRARLRLPERYFFTLATDYPHKNLSALLNAYAEFRKRWSHGTPPSLILAGHSLTPRTDLHSELSSRRLGQGARFLGPVSAHQLRVLYQDALAFVFPSLYEGFGLPPLEAMAAGAPVIAMPFSSVPEVCGDSALYPNGLSARHLAQAMKRLALDDDLRRDLKNRGLDLARQLTWEKTARATIKAYRSAVFNPSERSLAMRRTLRDAITNWVNSTPLMSVYTRVHEHMSIRHACLALNFAVRRRLRRELARLPMSYGRKGA